MAAGRELLPDVVLGVPETVVEVMREVVVDTGVEVADVELAEVVAEEEKLPEGATASLRALTVVQSLEEAAG